MDTPGTQPPPLGVGDVLWAGLLAVVVFLALLIGCELAVTYFFDFDVIARVH